MARPLNEPMSDTDRLERDLVAVVGPSGAGKSELALVLARAFDGEVVNCDALQVYRGVDVGTAKLPTDARRGVPHHLLDVVAPTEEFSAADFVARAVPAIEGIVGRGKLPIVVGGTGLYLRALRRGLFEGPGRIPELRRRLEGLAERRGTAVLHRLLRRWDPSSAARIHENDRVRIVRAIEVCCASGRPMSELMATRRRPLKGFRDILVGLRPPREPLSTRIELRAAEMLARGLAKEVSELKDEFGTEIPAFKAIGYRETLRLIDGEIDNEDACKMIARSTLRYAKRQMTWFRREEGTRWFDGFGDDPAVSRDVIDFLHRELNRRRPRLGSSPGSEETETLHAEAAT